MYHYSFLDTPIGTLTLIADDAALVEVWFPNHTEHDGGAGVDELDGAVLDPEHTVLRRASDQLGEYFAGTRTDVRRPTRAGGHAVPARRVAGAVDDPVRRDRELRGAGQAPR